MTSRPRLAVPLTVDTAPPDARHRAYAIVTAHINHDSPLARELTASDPDPGATLAAMAAVCGSLARLHAERCGWRAHDWWRLLLRRVAANRRDE